MELPEELLNTVTLAFQKLVDEEVRNAKERAGIWEEKYKTLVWYLKSSVEDAREYNENMKEAGFNISTIESEGYLRGAINAFNLVAEEDRDV